MEGNGTRPKRAANKNGRTAEVHATAADSCRKLVVSGTSIRSSASPLRERNLRQRSERGRISGSPERGFGAERVHHPGSNIAYPVSRCRKPAAFVSVDDYVDGMKKLAVSKPRREARKRRAMEFSRTKNGSLIRIGRGAFGLVYQGHCGKDDVAVKVASKVTVMRELDALTDIQSPFVVKLLDVVHTSMSWCLVLEKAEISVDIVLEKRCSLQLHTVRYIMACLLIALTEVHKAGWLHLDLKPSNVLLDKQGQVKLCDFSTARRYDTGTQFTDGVCVGSEGYWAPEIARGQPYDDMADWFSYGVTMYKMISGRLPWMINDLDMLYRVQEGRIHYDNSLFSDSSIDFMRSLLRENPLLRLGRCQGEVTAHCWFEGITWSNLDREKAINSSELQENVVGAEKTHHGVYQF